jgi:hypothetical protein
MKTIHLLFSGLLLLTFANCKHYADNVKIDCIEEMRDKYNLVPSNGDLSGCKEVLYMYHWRGKQCFSHNNTCEYVMSNAVDCEGNDVNSPSFWEEAVYKGIVGVKE